MLHHVSVELCYKIKVQKSNKVQWDASPVEDDDGVCVCVCNCECVRLVRTRSLSAMARLVSLCHCGVLTWGGGVRTLWATPGAFRRDHSSSPLVTMARRSSSSAHQATDPPRVTVLSFERKRDTLQKRKHTHTYIYININKSQKCVNKS